MTFKRVDVREDIKLTARERCFLPRWAQRLNALRVEDTERIAKELVETKEYIGELHMGRLAAEECIDSLRALENEADIQIKELQQQVSELQDKLLNATRFCEYPAGQCPYVKEQE